LSVFHKNVNKNIYSQSSKTWLVSLFVTLETKKNQHVEMTWNSFCCNLCHKSIETL